MSGSPVSPFDGPFRDTSTSTALLEKLQRPAIDRQAWEQVVKVYGPLIYRRCRSKGLQRADAQDATQEVFVRVLRSIKEFERRHTRAFRAWLGTITVRVIADFWWGTGEVAPGGSPAQERLAAGPARDEEEAFTRAEVRERVLAAAREWFGNNEAHWQAFRRHALDGRTAREVAEELGMTEANVAAIKSRTLRRLREEFGDLLREDGA